MVVAAGVTGLAGLVAGRWLADRVGRRPTAAVGLVGIVAFGTLTYAGSSAALVVGYLAGVFAGSVLAPRPSGRWSTNCSPPSSGPRSPGGSWWPV